MTQISLKLLRGQEDLLAWIIASLCLISFTSGFSHGASQSACADMKPKHISAHSQDKRNSFITVHINKSTFLPGDQVPVTVRSTRDFMGFLLQARRVADDRVAGTFILISPESKLLKCFEDGDTVTHSDKLLKRNLSFVWKAPDQFTGDIRFFVSAVQSYFIYWSRIQSGVISDLKQNYSTLTKNVELMGTLQTSVYNTTATPTPFTEAAVLPSLRFADSVNPQGSTHPMKKLSQTPVITKERALRSQDTYIKNNLSKVDQSPATQQSSLVLGEIDQHLQPSLNARKRGKLTALPTINGFLLKTLELESAESKNILNSESEFDLTSPSCIGCSNIEQVTTWSTSTVFDSRSSAVISGQDYSTFWPVSFTTGQEKESVPPDMEEYKSREGETTPTMSRGWIPNIEDVTPTSTARQLMSQRASANFLQSSKNSGSKVNPGKIVRNTSVRMTDPVQEDKGPGHGESPTKGAQLGIPQLGILLGCSAALGMALAVGMRHFFSQHCRKRTEVSFRDTDSSIMGVGDNGELVHVRKIRENSFVLVQAEYNVINPPITVGK
ncbi:reelin domain-containing protein 1-like [Leucoraja erinacea]|uniref:reelin domain-containing protein 1-like n=1 Tax=Leucoraja erinaceus TaxID=7782 RepID=UPI002454AC4A|nr:reelin domain-containing protein 1-like [Leucoraja erinacea]